MIPRSCNWQLCNHTDIAFTVKDYFSIPCVVAARQRTAYALLIDCANARNPQDDDYKGLLMYYNIAACCAFPCIAPNPAMRIPPNIDSAFHHPSARRLRSILSPSLLILLPPTY
jgi:hypothetical protein